MKKRGTAQLQTRDNFGGLGFSLVFGKVSPSLFLFYNLHVLGFGFCKCQHESPTLQAYVLLKEVPAFGMAEGFCDRGRTEGGSPSQHWDLKKTPQATPLTGAAVTELSFHPLHQLSSWKCC